ncbi:Plant lipid transfer protein/Par allergen [Corchorus olitorius]|uniref:Non-specific lipid-transfer protein n=1 Tax=Corchorus olitorius TaxID=93759 RepID=A0A1R3JGU9_9ROSI|nr:Plant lipid transfer protein/Par allergen [Corchorus olitorius]
MVEMLCMLVVINPMATAALSCKDVAHKLSPCIKYIKSSENKDACCNGVRALNGMAHTPADHQQACKCIKQQLVFIAITDREKKMAEAIPGVCNVKVPYKISSSTDCTK